ncbi:MAG TPA: hypothetical protein VF809_00245, partial [Candidatus Saccharimonadales bacterium]
VAAEFVLKPGGNVDVSAPSGAITLEQALTNIGLGGYLDVILQSIEQSASAELAPYSITQ